MCEQIKIVKSIRKSFAYNLLKASVLILLMILLLFQVKPSSAFIYAELEQIDLSSFEGKSEVVKISNISHDYTSIVSQNKIFVELDGLSINGKSYSKDEYLEILPVEGEQVFLDFFGEIENAYFYNADLHDIKFNSITSNSATFNFTGEQELKVDNGTVYIYITQSMENGAKLTARI